MWKDDDQYNEYLRGQLDVMEVLSNAIKNRQLYGDHPTAIILNEILNDLYKEVSKILKLS